ncbi:MAG: iron-sulfur cluster assembly accessory protein, partial [Verrucomicrobia bacterium]|nr:iron-sulfur cluster assembly accessory protein [Verrucomicrobiota bacterium]
RISIEDGGCAGRQYGMEFTASRAEDYHIPLDGVEVIIDPDSARFLAGSTLDYTDGLTGTGFKILNPHAVRSCGCGTSFEFAEEPR